ncbi:MAG: hypothetical protein GY861_12690 [bacterium]|nr:hypothetical protein [bacterium]
MKFDTLILCYVVLLLVCMALFTGVVVDRIEEVKEVTISNHNLINRLIER